MGKRILILSASAGTGHLRAAAALQKVFEQMPEVEEVCSLDALKYTNRLFRDFYSGRLSALPRAAGEKFPLVLGTNRGVSVKWNI